MPRPEALYCSAKCQVESLQQKISQLIWKTILPVMSSVKGTAPNVKVPHGTVHAVFHCTY